MIEVEYMEEDTQIARSVSCLGLVEVMGMGGEER